MILLSSVLVGICVSAGGMIGFVGLLVPHLARRMVGSLHRRLIPVAAIWGAAFLILSDLIARVVYRPLELPVGVVTALVGTPVFFLIFLRKTRANNSQAVLS
jgi:iron complex transport system permease protein